MGNVSLERLEAQLAEPVEPRTAKFVPDVSARLNSSNPKVELPGDGRLLSDFALELAEILKHQGLYERGGLAFVLNQDQDGLEVITPQLLRTLVERHLVCYRIKSREQGEIML